MNTQNARRPIALWIAAAIALLFGLATLKSGGSVLFIDGPDRAAAGHYVPFILWFNFLAGFSYIIAAIGLFGKKPWAAKLAMVICLATLIAFAMLAVMILQSVPYETRTVAAMTLRSLIWAIISMIAYRAVLRK